MALSFILELGIVFLTRVQTKSPNSLSTKNPYGEETPVDSSEPNDVVLTVTNHSKVVQFTLKSLWKLVTIQASIFKPFVKVPQTFTVVTLAKIFKSANSFPTADVMTGSLNDYVYTNSPMNFTDSRGQLAIARFGVPIPHDQGGTIPIILPDKSVLGKNTNVWNWSLSVIRVK